MKWILLSAVLLLSACSFTSSVSPTPFGRLMFGLMIQEPDEYPLGWLCTPSGDRRNGVQTAEHPCACKRMVTTDDCEGEPSHENVCKQWCHERRCGCPVTCEMPK